MAENRPTIQRPLAFFFLAIMVTLTLFLVTLSEIHLQGCTFLVWISTTGVLGVVARSFKTKKPSLSRGVESSALLLLFWGLFMIATYLVPEHASATYDTEFSVIDRLTFEVPPIIAFSRSHPVLDKILTYFYSLLFIHLAAMPIYWALRRQRDRAYITLNRIFLAAFAALFFFGLLPAYNTIHFYNIEDLHQVLVSVDQLKEIRTSAFATLRFSEMENLVQFPSIYVSVQVLLLIDIFENEGRFARIVASIWTLFICWSAISIGGYYFVSIMGGIIVALASYLALSLLKRYFRKRATLKKKHVRNNFLPWYCWIVGANQTVAMDCKLIKRASWMALIFLLLYVQNVVALEQTYYWDSDEESKPLLPFLKDALGEEGGQHIFTIEDLERHLEAREVPLPKCFEATEKCASPFSLVIQSLKLAGVLKLRKTEDGFSFALTDERKDVIRSAKIIEQDPKKAAYALISKLFDATGTVVFITDPPGADVRIDGKVEGQTPFHLQLPIAEFKYTISLLGYRPIDAEFSLKKGQIHTIETELITLHGSMKVEGIADAEILINGKRIGFSDEDIDIEPGIYTIQIAKEGYLSQHENIEIKPGDRTIKKVRLERSNPFLREVSTEAIAHRKFILRLSFEHSFQRASFQDAKSGDNKKLIGLVDKDQQLSIDEAIRGTLQTNGARLEFLYQLENFGLAVASFSLLTGSTEHRAFVAAADGQSRSLATIRSSNRLQFRPFQLTYRRFYKNFVPTAELGLGVDLHWFNATLDDSGEEISFQRSEAFWTLGLAGQYFFTNSLFGIFRYSFQDYFTGGPGADHQFSLGVGISFGNVFGFDPEPPEQL